VRLPDFVIGGAPRSGTTWLAGALDRHPRIWLAKPVRPEPKFFLVDELYERGLEWYSRTWFSGVPVGVVAGEKSTNYLESPDAAARMSRDLPHVRLVFVLREPVARAVSNFHWSTMNGMETADFASAVALETQRERLLPENQRYARPNAYVSRGEYAHLLRPWLERFPREQLLVLRFEDLVEDPAITIARVHAHLGVSEQAELVRDLDGLSDAVNASREEQAVDAVTVAELRAHYAPEND
jgi:hypothetical protein